MTGRIALILGGVLLVVGGVFVAQNAHVVEVSFLAWSVQLSLALVIFLSGVGGVLLGTALGSAFRVSRR